MPAGKLLNCKENKRDNILTKLYGIYLVKQSATELKPQLTYVTVWVVRGEVVEQEVAVWL